MKLLLHVRGGRCKYKRVQIPDLFAIGSAADRSNRRFVKPRYRLHATGLNCSSRQSRIEGRVGGYFENRVIEGLGSRFLGDQSVDVILNLLR